MVLKTMVSLQVTLNLRSLITDSMSSSLSKDPFILSSLDVAAHCILDSLDNVTIPMLPRHATQTDNIAFERQWSDKMD